MVEGAAKAGWTLTGRHGDTVHYTFGNTHKSGSKILHVLPFDSDRRRMSVIVPLPEIAGTVSGGALLLTKGADSVVLPLCTAGAPIPADVVETLNKFADQGLRTLCLAQRIVTAAELAEFSAAVNAANMDIGGKQAALSQLASNFEQNLEFVGCTAVEDRLAEGVGNTVYFYLYF